MPPRSPLPHGRRGVSLLERRDQEWRDALASLRAVEQLGHARASTARAAASAVLVAVGPEGVLRLLSGDPEAVGVRRLIVAAASLDRLACGLALVPPKGGDRGVRRAGLWSEIVSAARDLRQVITTERRS